MPTPPPDRREHSDSENGTESDIAAKFMKDAEVDVIAALRLAKEASQPTRQKLRAIFLLYGQSNMTYS